ncbi:MAG TPA: sialidase family protein, partial [Planctomycetaceae bacterium]|nr:sialidase family protein [Planctomycetaceae bacterium]
GKSRDRRNVTVKLSHDDGQTWLPGRAIEPGASSYSDIAVTPAGTILCFYGRGPKPGFAGTALTMARFNLKWLTETP